MNTESIGHYTTKSVVNSIFLVIACDAVFLGTPDGAEIMKKALITVRDVVTAFDDNLVHDRVSCTVYENEIYALLGEAGQVNRPCYGR